MTPQEASSRQLGESRERVAQVRGTVSGASGARAPAAEYALKRPLEVTLAVVGLLLSLPLGLIIAFLVWREDHGPVFVRQMRVGRNGIPFSMIKFRTMRDHSNVGVSRQATAEDDRVTRVGRILRTTALDELPQLINVLRGEMSFVGPRALLPEEIEVDPRSPYRRIEDVPGHTNRILVRPGLTGLAQVYAARDASRRRKFKYDALYVQRMSFWLDVRLIILSIFISLTGCWHRRGRPLRSWRKHPGPLP